MVLPEVSPQGLANSLLGLAKLGWIPDRLVMEQLTRGSLPKITNLNPQVGNVRGGRVGKTRGEAKPWIAKLGGTTG